MWKTNCLAANKAMRAKDSYKNSRKTMQASDSYQKSRSKKSAAPLKNLIKQRLLKVSSGKMTLRSNKCVYKFCFHSQKNPSRREVALGLSKEGYWTVKGKEQYGYAALCRSIGHGVQQQNQLSKKIMVKKGKNNWVSLHTFLYK